MSNYFKPGPASQEGPLQYRICKPEFRPGQYAHPGCGIWYVAGNYVVGNPKVTADNWDGGVQFEDEALPMIKLDEVRARAPFPAAHITQQSAEEAYELVLATVGASVPRRDAVDARIVKEVRTGKPTFGNGIINSEQDVGGWPELRSARAPLDSDHDGMPDAWERKFALSPRDPTNGPQDRDHDGYTNVEECLNATDPTEYVDYRETRNNVNTLYGRTRRT